LIEIIRSLAASVRSDFQNLKLPTNIITDSLLSDIEGQVTKFLNLMTLQVAAENNDILRELFRSIKNDGMKKLSSFDEYKDLLPKQEVKTSWKNRKPKPLKMKEKILKISKRKL
jgi:hypothetical protein